MGGVTISAVFLSANLGGSTSAYAGGRMNVTAGSLGLASNSMNTSSSTLFTVSVSRHQRQRQFADADGDAQHAGLHRGGLDLAAGGANLSVMATSNSSATADVEGGTGSVAGVNGFLAVGQHNADQRWRTWAKVRRLTPAA